MSEHKILSPLPGTFYRCPAPGAEPFVNVGDGITPDTIVGVVEVMKQFTEIEAGVSGKLVSFEVDDGGTVDSDQVLALVNVS